MAKKVVKKVTKKVSTASKSVPAKKSSKIAKTDVVSKTKKPSKKNKALQVGSKAKPASKAASKAMPVKVIPVKMNAKTEAHVRPVSVNKPALQDLDIKPSKPSISKAKGKSAIKKSDELILDVGAQAPLLKPTPDKVKAAPEKAKQMPGLLQPKAAKPAKVIKEKVIKEPKESKKAKTERLNLLDEQAKWTDYYEKFRNEPAEMYSMREKFEAKQPIEHKVLGWGFILSNENDRLEVVFKSGVKILISNYKS